MIRSARSRSAWTSPGEETKIRRRSGMILPGCLPAQPRLVRRAVRRRQQAVVLARLVAADAVLHLAGERDGAVRLVFDPEPVLARRVEAATAEHHGDRHQV